MKTTEMAAYLEQLDRGRAQLRKFNQVAGESLICKVTIDFTHFRNTEKLTLEIPTRLLMKHGTIGLQDALTELNNEKRKELAEFVNSGIVKIEKKGE